MTASIWSGLLPTKPTRTPAPRLEPKPARTTNLVGQARELLRRQGPLSAREIADVLGVESTSKVSSWLVYDKKKGRLELRDGRYHYNPEYDDLQAEELARAAEMLRRHGYEVTKQGEKA